MMTDPSSITSVTEEDSDESDTTESSYSKTLDSVSSVLYSSECNTDDKLSTSLTNVSISKSNIASKKRRRKHVEADNDNEPNDSATTTDPPYPYGCHPQPLDRNKQKISQAKKKPKNFHSTALTRYVLQKRLIHKAQSSCLPKQEEENFGVDDPNNHLYTDFSDTSSVPWYSNNDDLDSDDDDGECQSDASNSRNERPFLPNMSSESWFQARCFDRYWSNYKFVMEWYRQHVEAVNMLSSQFAWRNAGAMPQFKPKKRNKVKRAKTRARNRRLAKAKQKANQAKTNESGATTHDSGSNSNAVENELEMEITEDMMDFFTTSFKHRMERDQSAKEGNCDSIDNNGEYRDGGDTDRKVPSLSGPREQPGIRRTVEMKILYGQGAPMIHGMETALQMTYDKVLDRHKPKPWPNMPLKIVFAKS